jgi:protein SCO1/2
MKTQARRAAFAVALTGLVLSIVFARPARMAAQSRYGANYFPDVTLTTQDGKDVKFYDLIKGRIVAIDVIYTNCQYACPIETSKLARMQQLLGDRMGREVFFISISIDPEHDTPAVLKAYAEKFSAGPGWIFLTGKMSDIDVLTRKIGLWSDPKATQDGHEPMLLVGNEATGQWMRTSALDNPAYTARIVTDWLTSWQRAQGGKSYTEATRVTARRDDGEYMFKNLCSGCHTIGQGDKIGPDLGRALAAHDRGWLADYTLRPDVLREQKDPIAMALRQAYREVRMPNLSLNPGEVQAILGYVDRARTRAGAPAQPTPVASPSPVATTGRTSATTTALTTTALAIHAALTRDTIVGVSARAKALADAATEAHLPALATAASELGRQRTIADARRVFGNLGEQLVAYARSHDDVRAAGVRIGYCPMVRKSWLQMDGPVKNPYYGRRMLACGELTN